ncbi:hypothetical protein J6590_088182 [Homalodisca vitripennis]|nr:hypothetical protein J6590_088182 [Homalodisca vitripennis]
MRLQKQSKNQAFYRSRFDCVLMATETWPLVSSVGRPAPPPFITSDPQPMTLPRDLASPDEGHVHVARSHELRNNSLKTLWTVFQKVASPSSAVEPTNYSTYC